MDRVGLGRRLGLAGQGRRFERRFAGHDQATGPVGVAGGSVDGVAGAGTSTLGVGGWTSGGGEVGAGGGGGGGVSGGWGGGVAKITLLLAA
jgi:hypothetical protein